MIIAVITDQAIKETMFDSSNNLAIPIKHLKFRFSVLSDLMGNEWKKIKIGF